MAIAHFTATLTAVGTSLKTLLGLTDSQDIPLQSISLQADPANAGAAFVGGTGVTITDYLVRIPIPVSSVPSPPLIYESGTARPMKLSEVFVVGTAGDKLHVGGVGY